MGSTVAGMIRIAAGSMADYAATKEFHYRGGNPGGVTRVLKAVYENAELREQHPERQLLAGVLVEALPALACALRGVALGGRFECGDRRLSAARLNREMRTIARVIVHPMFRSAGVAVRLVEEALASAQTPYVEALAAMGRVHPFFKRAGMTEYDRPPLAGHVRLTAALARVGRVPLDLVGTGGWELSAFLRRELARFTHLGEESAAGDLVAEAGRRLLSQPVYYLWKRP